MEPSDFLKGFIMDLSSVKSKVQFLLFIQDCDVIKEFCCTYLDIILPVYSLISIEPILGNFKEVLSALNLLNQLTLKLI